MTHEEAGISSPCRLLLPSHTWLVFSFVLGIVVRAYSKQLQRTVRDKVPSHVPQRAAAEPER